jgi:hypothetical protein
MDPVITAVVVLLVAIVISRFISEAALKTLSSDQKAALLDAFAPIRKYGLLALIVIVVGSYRNAGLFGAGILVYILGTLGVGYYRIRNIDVPPSYLRSLALSAAVSIAGLAAFFYLIWGR